MEGDGGIAGSFQGLGGTVGDGGGEKETNLGDKALQGF